MAVDSLIIPASPPISARFGRRCSERAEEDTCQSEERRPVYLWGRVTRGRAVLKREQACAHKQSRSPHLQQRLAPDAVYAIVPQFERGPVRAVGEGDTCQSERRCKRDTWQQTSVHRLEFTTNRSAAPVGARGRLRRHPVPIAGADLQPDYCRINSRDLLEEFEAIGSLCTAWGALRGCCRRPFSSAAASLRQGTFRAP